MLSAALIAKIIGAIGVILLAIPVIRDGRFFTLLTPLGKSTKNPELIAAIETLQEQFKDSLTEMRKSDLNYIYWGLGLVLLSYLIEIVVLLIT